MTSFTESLEARRSLASARAHRRMAWVGALTSLWTPITVLAIALLPYLLVEELIAGSWVWAQPVMKAVALILFIYNVGLALAELAIPRWAAIRKARRESAELLGEVKAAFKKAPQLDASAREKVVAQAAALDEKRIGSDVAALKNEAQKLVELASKHLPRFRKSAGTDFWLGLVKALAVALLIRSVLIEPYRIPSGSMIPTLQVGDQIFVNKFLYGIRIPLTNWVPFVMVRPPERGDVIVFENPPERQKPAILRDDFIKRVAGIPGDVVELRNNVVFVNGVVQKRETLEDPYVFWDYNKERDWFQVRGQLFSEELGTHSHQVIQQPRDLANTDYGPYIVPPGHVFVMGDNRDSSLDSRFGLGSPSGTVEYVPYGNIKGKAMIIWLSLCHGGVGSAVTGAAGLCTDRLFRPVR